MTHRIAVAVAGKQAAVVLLSSFSSHCHPPVENAALVLSTFKRLQR
jgi:hypothetical protein